MENEVASLEEQTAEKCVALGIQYVEEKNFDLAIKEFTQAIQLNPNCAEAYINRGFCYREQENDELYKLALIDYNKAIELNPDNETYYINRGDYCNSIGINELALIDYNKAIELNSNFSEAYIRRGFCYYTQENYEFAINDYNEAIRLNPNDASLYTYRANCYKEQKNYEDALNNYNKAIQLNPNNGFIYMHRGICYQEQKYYEDALNDYSEAIRLEPNDALPYIHRAIYYQEQKYYEYALNDYNEAIRLDYDTAKLFSDLTEIGKDNKNNLQNYIEIIQLNDDGNKVYDSFKKRKEICFLISNISIIEKNYQKARYYIENAFDYLPEDIKHKQEELRHKQVYLDNIDNTEELDKANKKLAEKNKELNNLIAMFAHNFLGTLQCIRSNAEHDNNAKIHLKTVKMMSGALTAFSIISADDDKLIEQLKQDNTGETNLLQNLANNLALAISQLLSKTNKDKIINLYLNYLRKTNQIEKDTTSEELGKNRDYRKKWQALQHQWEDEFNDLFSENVELSSLQTWLADNFFPVQITGFDNYNIRFKEYGITDSIFLVVFMEILVNALKYMDVSQNKPLILMLEKQDQHYHLICENPSSQETYRGTHKGMDFLKSIARKLNAQFITESNEQQFKTTFIIPAELLD